MLEKQQCEWFFFVHNADGIFLRTSAVSNTCTWVCLHCWPLSLCQLKRQYHRSFSLFVVMETWCPASSAAWNWSEWKQYEHGPYYLEKKGHIIFFSSGAVLWLAPGCVKTLSSKTAIKEININCCCPSFRVRVHFSFPQQLIYVLCLFLFFYTILTGFEDRLLTGTNYIKLNE